MRAASGCCAASRAPPTTARRSPRPSSRARRPRTASALRPASWYADRGVELLLGTRAAALDCARHVVTLDDGHAAGLRAAAHRHRQPPAPPGAARRIRQRPHAAHARGRPRAARRARRGRAPGHRRRRLHRPGGRGRGGARPARTTTIVEAAAAPLAAVLGPAVGTWFADLHRSEGVDVVLGASIAAATGTDRVERADPERRPPAGVRPRPRRRRRRPRPRVAGRQRPRPRRGRASAPTGHTGAPGVFAGGRRDGRAAHWESAARQGVAAARAMLGLGSARPRRRELLERPLRHARALPRRTRAAPTPPRSTAIPRGATSASPSPARGAPVAVLLVGRPHDLPTARALLAA